MIDWGDVPTWLGACFAALAAGAAVWTLKSQRDQIGEQRVFIAEQSANLELERAELRAAAEDRRVAQARQVRMHQIMAASTMVSGVPGQDDHWIVTIHNTSDAPVHDVQVWFGTSYTAAEVYELAPSAHNFGALLGDRLVAPVHLLGPGRGARFMSQHFSPTTLHNSKPSVTFTDDGGVQWRLDYYGKLEEAPATQGA